MTDTLTLATVYTVQSGSDYADKVSVQGGEVNRVTLDVARDPTFLTRFGNRVKCVGGKCFRQQQHEMYRRVTLPLDKRFPKVELVINDILTKANVREVVFGLGSVDELRSFYNTTERVMYHSGDTLQDCADRVSEYLLRKLTTRPKEYFATQEEAQAELQRREDRAQARQEEREARKARVDKLVAVFNSLGYTASREGYDVALDEDAASQLLKDLASSK